MAQETDASPLDFVGAASTSVPPETLAKRIIEHTEQHLFWLHLKTLRVPGSFFHFIGVVEVLGGIGLIIPSVLRILPFLTPVAACGLVIIMAGATVMSLPMG